MPRNTVKTPELIAKLEYAFSVDADVATACFYAGISETTFYRWGSEDETFRDRMKSLKNKPVMKALETVIDSLDDVSNAKWFLERRSKEFAQQNKTKLVTDDGKGGDAPIGSVDLSQLSDSALNELKKISDEDTQQN